MKRKFVNAAILALVVVCVAVAAGAAPGEVMAAGIVEETVVVLMPDGVRLEGTLARPVVTTDGGDEKAQASSYPTILVRTPYGRQQQLEEARFWARRGYAVLVQDVRGKWGSNGEYVPFLNEYADGMETLDWIVAQAWSSGSVGMWGSSYLALCQLLLASAGHPALKSIMPISGWLQDDGAIEVGGAHHIMLSIPWILHEEAQTKRSIADVEMDELFEFLPLIDAFSSVGLESKIWNEEFDFSPLEKYSAANIHIPVFHMTGWNDFVCEASLRIYEQAISGEAGQYQKLMVGPWIHDQFWTTYTEVGDDDFGPSSALGRQKLMELSLDWFDMTLKQKAQEISAWPHVRVFVMGANEWRDYDRWPPANVRPRRLFISSERGANSSRGDGSLSEQQPPPGHDTYVFDPMNPVPTYGGANFHFLMHLVGVKDQREIEERDDVLVYTTAPLEEDLTLAGPIEAVLYASTEGRDTDFTAKLVEVRPNGYAAIIEEGIIRASHRNGSDERELLEPGAVYRLNITLGSTAMVVPKGNRIRLEISSSNFPKYDRNPNTGEEPLQARVLKAVTQTVYYGGDYPSQIVLPAVEGYTNEARR
jgi:putative CocE/NonD family hydrolase